MYQMRMIDAIQRGCAFAAAAAAFHGSPSPLSPSLSVQARQRAMMGGRQAVENTACLVVVADTDSRGPFHLLGRKHDGDRRRRTDGQFTGTCVIIGSGQRLGCRE